jgi:acyl carrier protein
MEQRIRNAFVSAFGIRPEAFHAGLSPATVENWDSLGHVRLVEALQDEFRVEFDMEEVMEMENVERIRDILTRHGIEG